MRVLHVTDCYLPRLGGIERHVHDLAEHQRDAGIDARVLTTTPRDQGGPPSPDPTWVHRLDAPADGSGPGLLHAVDAVLAAAAEAGPVVLHVHVSVVSPFATLVARRAARGGVPTLVTLHSMWAHLAPLPRLAGAALGLGSWPVAWSAVSTRAAEPLRVALGPGVDVAVLPNAVDASAWTRTPQPDPVPLITTVGRLARTKRTTALVPILRDVRALVPREVPLRAVVVGDGPLRGRLEQGLRRHGLDDWVTLAGRLDRPAIGELLARSWVYLSPSDLESFGIAALEARTAGLPVVAHRRGGVGDFLEHGTHGLLGADDAAMAAGVTRLVTDDALRARVAATNARPDPTWGWDAELERCGALYERAAALAEASDARGVRVGAR